MFSKLFGSGPAPAPAPAPAPSPVPAPVPAPTSDPIPIQDPSTKKDKDSSKTNTPNGSTNNLQELGKEDDKNKTISNDTETNNDKNSIASTPPKDDKTGSSYSSRMGRFFGIGKNTSSPSDPVKDATEIKTAGGVSTPDKPTDQVEKKDTNELKKDSIEPKNDTPETKKNTITTESNIDATLTAGGGSIKDTKDKDKNIKNIKDAKDTKDTNVTKDTKDNSKSSGKSTTPTSSSNNLQGLENNSTLSNSTEVEPSKDKSSKDSSKSNSPNTTTTTSNNVSDVGNDQQKLASADQKKTLTPIKENDSKDSKGDSTPTVTAAENTSTKPVGLKPIKAIPPVKPDKQQSAEKIESADSKPVPEPLKTEANEQDATTKTEQSPTADSVSSDKKKSSVSKDLSKELNEVAKEKAEQKPPVKPAKNEITIVKGDVIDVQNVGKAIEVVYNELLHLQGSINAVHDKAVPIFTSFDNQLHGTVVGKVSSSEFAQVIKVLTDGKELEKAFSDSCVTVYNNFCDVQNMLDYNSWLAAMGFERSDEELYNALASSLSGLIGTDNRSQSKIEKYFSANIGQPLGQPSSTADGLNRFIEAVSALGLNFTKREITRMYKILSSSSSGLPQSSILKTISDSNNDISFEQKCLSFLKRTSLHVSDNDTTKSNDKDKSKSKEKKPLKYGLRSGAEIERAIHRTIKEKFLNPIEIIHSIILAAYPDMNPNDQNYNTVLSIPKQNIAVAIRDIGDNITDGEMQRLLLYLNKGKPMSAADDMKASLDLNTLSMLFRAPSAETIVIKKLVISLKNDKSSSPVDPTAAPVIKRKVTCELAATTSANTLAWNSKLSSQESSSGSWTWELDQIEPVPCSIKGSNVIFKITEDQIDDIVDTTSSSQINDGDDSTQNKEEGNSNPPVKKLLAAGNVSIPLDALKDFALVPSSLSSPSSIENIKFVKVPMLDSDNNEIGDVKFAFSVQRDSSLDDMARAHRKEIEKAEAERGIKNDPLVLVSDYISDIITALLTHISKPEPEAIDAKPRLRRNRRMLAQQEGHLGGRKVLTDIQAVIKLQALWRGKRIRKRKRRQYIAIRVIQRFIRGKIQRKRFKLQIRRYKQLESSETERLERLRRIRAQERELVLLQGISGSDYIGFERLRKTNSVKVIQRFWRVKQSKNPLSASPRHAIGDESKVTSEEMKIQREKARLLDTIQQVHGNQIPPKRVLQTRDIDPLGLAQLQRRIRDTAQSNAKMREKARFNPIATSNRLFDNKPGLDPTKKGPRRRYQELAEAQQRVSLLLDNYLMKKPIRQHHSKDRSLSLGNCKALVEDLKTLPTLEEARDIIKNKKQAAVRQPVAGEKEGKKPNLAVKTSHEDVSDWFDDLSHDDIESSVLTHVKGMNAIRSKNEWALVTAPHDVTGPPINIKELSKANDCQLQADGIKLFPSPAAAWISGKDSEESLMWIAYAAQPNKFGTKAEADDAGAPKSPNPEDEKSHKAARAILGDVNGEELLVKLAKELSTVQTRREYVREKVDSERNRERQLAEVFENEALSLIRQNMALNAHRNLSDIDKKRRDDASRKIQSLYRGQSDRKKVSVLQAEKRVVAALQVLLSELQKDGKSAVQMDAASLYKLTFGKHSSSIISDNSKKSNSINDKAKSVSSVKAIGSLGSGDKKVISEKKNVSYDLKPTLSFVDDIHDTEYTIASPKTPLSARDSNLPRNHIPSGSQLKRSTEDMDNMTPLSDRLNEVSVMSQSQYSPLRGDGYISSPSQSGTLESFSPYPNHGFPLSPRPDIQSKSTSPSPRIGRDSK